MPKHQIQTKRLAVKLTTAGERAVRSGHPWVFSNSITKITEGGNPGDLAVVFGRKSNRVLAVGLYDPNSPITIKILHTGSSVTISEAFFRKKIENAYRLRTKLREHTNAYRLLFGENDGLPGVITDMYNQTTVVKLYSEAWFPYLNLLVKLILQTTGAQTAVLRLSRNIQRLENTLQEGVIQGDLADPEVVFHEYGVRFSANLLLGHKTGFFLDHRHNRHQVGSLAFGKTVLDLFSYAGGFSVHALAGGAKEVTSVDISRQALELAVLNGKINTPSGKHNTISGDVFQVLETLLRENKKYDIVVIDPPSFAKSKQEITTARNKYATLASKGAKLTASGGLLVLASCSSRITANEFFSLHEELFLAEKINYERIAITEHDTDHPITFPEAAYLKTGYYRIG